MVEGGEGGRDVGFLADFPGKISAEKIQHPAASSATATCPLPVRVRRVNDSPSFCTAASRSHRRPCYRFACGCARRFGRRVGRTGSRHAKGGRKTAKTPRNWCASEISAARYRCAAHLLHLSNHKKSKMVRTMPNTPISAAPCSVKPVPNRVKMCWFCLLPRTPTGREERTCRVVRPLSRAPLLPCGAACHSASTSGSCARCARFACMRAPLLSARCAGHRLTTRRRSCSPLMTRAGSTDGPSGSALTQPWPCSAESHLFPHFPLPDKPPHRWSGRQC